MPDTHANSRLEAFSDGVFAIALTLLIIDVKLPATENVTSTPEFWLALQRLTPTILAFMLSFGVILITWVNHHAALKLVDKSTPSFMYANGLLLLTVVFIPFPTSLVGEFLLTDHAAPAVVLYDLVLAAQSIGWILMTRTVLKNRLARDDGSAAAMREKVKSGYFALALYSLLAFIASRFPLAVAVITLLTWIFWLVLSTARER